MAVGLLLYMYISISIHTFIQYGINTHTRTHTHTLCVRECTNACKSQLELFNMPNCNALIKQYEGKSFDSKNRHKVNCKWEILRWQWINVCIFTCSVLSIASNRFANATNGWYTIIAHKLNTVRQFTNITGFARDGSQFYIDLVTRRCFSRLNKLITIIILCVKMKD